MSCCICFASVVVTLLAPALLFLWKFVSDKIFLKTLVHNLFIRLSHGVSHYVKMEEGSLHYVTMNGNLSKGPDIVVIHGLSSQSADFALMAKGIRSISHSAIFVDLPAHGKTTIPLPDSESFDDLITKFAQLVHSLLKDQKYILIGHSMGGYTSMRFASLYPLQVSALILISPAGAPKLSQDITHIKQQFNPTSYQDASWSIDNIFSKTGSIPCFVRPLLIIGLRSWAKNPAVHDIISRIRPTDCINEIDAGNMKGIPRLLIWGNDEGLLCVRHFEYLKGILAGDELRVVELEDTGHMAPSECPNVLEKEMKAFLNDFNISN